MSKNPGTHKKNRRKKHSVPVFFRKKHARPFVGTLVRPLWRAVAPGLKPLRLPRAQLQVSFRKGATSNRALFLENLNDIQREGILWVVATL